MKAVMVMRHAVLTALASTLLNGCAYVDRLKSIGEQPPLTAVDNPTTRPGYKPVQMPMPAARASAWGATEINRVVTERSTGRNAEASTTSAAAAGSP